MSRRHSAEKRTILPDAKFGDLVLSKFMNNLMYDGKKSAALVRGVDNYNHWDPEPMTEVDFDPVMAAHMVEIRRQFMSRNKGRA